MNEKIVFEITADITLKELRELLADLECVGVVEQTIEQLSDRKFRATFNRNEWNSSWSSVGRGSLSDADLFSDELQGMTEHSEEKCQAKIKVKEIISNGG